ncbi:uncharacterized protein LOC132173823 isoform X2 [Corylus avellana]|uniref:uncharacterized protein LOC132173823 isoform X2 n=1 Tax=Corylus avellana TaxID=13451 RepID=UPI00286B4642|nr:uncharacterized protein LOC132173823 isoform X2 [Corylus avellana]
MGVCNEEKWIEHYSSSHKILLVGEGDFSFAVCLAKAFGTAENMIAASFDSKEVLTNAYPNVIMANLEELKQRRCTVLHHVDAHTMYRHPQLRSKLFDRIVFNFPHAGFIGWETEKRQIEIHRTLVRGFLSNANHMLTKNGEVHITHKTAYPFSKWEIVELAEEIGLCLIEKVPFAIRYYPGYVNKRGSGAKINQTFPLGECSTFKFASNILFHNTLIDGMCNAGKPTIAREMFSSLPTKGLQPNDRTSNIMINGFCKEELLNEARELFEKMNKNGCSPDHFTYNIIIQGFLQHNECEAKECMLVEQAARIQRRKDEEGEANEHMLAEQAARMQRWKNEKREAKERMLAEQAARMQRRKDEEHEAKKSMLAEQAARIQRKKDEEGEAKKHMLVEQAARMQRWKDEEREAKELMLAEQAVRMKRRKDEEREAKESMLAEQAARMQRWKGEEREAKERMLVEKAARMQRKKDEEREANERMVAEQAARMQRRKDEESEANEHMLAEQAARMQTRKDEERETKDRMLFEKAVRMQRRKDEEREAKERMLVEQTARMQRRKDEERETKDRMLAEKSVRIERWKDEEREAKERMLAEQAARMQRRKKEEREVKERILAEQAARMQRRKDEERVAKERMLAKQAATLQRRKEEECEAKERMLVSYSSILAAPYDPFADPSQKPSIKYDKTSEYMALPYSQNLFFVELNRVSSSLSPGDIAVSYFPPNFHWIPEHPLKNLAYYSAILKRTGSVFFKAIPDRLNPQKTIYHSIYFKKIIFEKEWGNHPSASRSLNGFNIPCNYYDYIDAYFKFLLHQTSKFEHSWFVSFDKDFCGILPLWFSRWWNQFGLLPDILPLQLVDAFQLFKSHFKVDSYGAKFSTMLHFVKKFKIPWILRWQYHISEDKIQRHWYIKWWDKCSLNDSIVLSVKNMVHAPKALPAPKASALSNLLIPPSAFSSPKREKESSPASSHSASSSSSKKNSSKKKEMIEALLAALDNLDDEEDETSKPSAEKPIQVPPYFEDSQDYYPYPGVEDM